MIDKIANSFVNLLGKSLNKEAQEIKKRFVVKYFHKGEFIGYHAGTSCTMTPNILDAKRYSGDPTEQIETIGRNLNSVYRSPSMDETDFAKGLTKALLEPVYNHFWHKYNREDIFIDFEYLPDNTEPQTFTVKRIQ